MNYKEALNFIYGTGMFGSRLGLDTIKKLLSLMGNPQKNLKYIHIAGTNGKGSVSAYVTNILQEAGYKVGLFTSPYLERFNERISINGIDIPDEELARITEMIKEKIDIMIKEGFFHPTSFEVITAMAFQYFYEKNVDYVVLEVGLGGRLDCTNIIDNSLVSVITTISKDHMHILGDSIGKIAYEKAGIIKKDGLVISYPQDQEALQVLQDISKERNAEFILYPMENIEIKKINDYGAIFDYKYKGEELKNIDIKMIGEHQIYNAALALTVVFELRKRKLIKIDDEHILNGLNKTKWKGRLEVLMRAPIFLIDGAHNVQGVESLKKALKLFKYDKLILGIGILKDKDVDHMIEKLAPLADTIIITKVPFSERTMSTHELAEKISKYNKSYVIEEETKKSIEKAIEIANENDLILFSGSLYLIGDVRKIIMENM